MLKWPQNICPRETCYYPTLEWRDQIASSSPGSLRPSWTTGQFPQPNRTVLATGDDHLCSWIGSIAVVDIATVAVTIEIDIPFRSSFLPPQGGQIEWTSLSSAPKLPVGGVFAGFLPNPLPSSPPPAIVKQRDCSVCSGGNDVHVVMTGRTHAVKPSIGQPPQVANWNNRRTATPFVASVAKRDWNRHWFSP